MRGTGCAQVLDGIKEGLIWAPAWVARAAEAYHQFTVHTIFLCSKFQCYIADSQEFCCHSHIGVKLVVVDKEVCIAHAEGSHIRVYVYAYSPG
jgi:hypothetical protein